MEKLGIYILQYPTTTPQSINCLFFFFWERKILNSRGLVYGVFFLKPKYHGTDTGHRESNLISPLATLWPFFANVSRRYSMFKREM